MKKKILGILLALFSFVNCFCVKVDALQISLQEIPYVYHLVTTRGEAYLDEELLYYGNTPSYCLEWSLYAAREDVYTAVSWDDYNKLTDSTKQLVAAIAHFGYPYNGRDTLYYCAAQDLIWDIVDPGGFVSITWYEKGTLNNIEDQIEQAQAEIMADVNAFLYTPNFELSSSNDTYVDGKVVEVQVGEKIQFIDKNGNLSLSKIGQNDFGDNAVVSGNYLDITVTEYGEKTISFTNGTAENGYISAPFVLHHDVNQDIVVTGTAYAGSTSLKIKGTGSSIIVEKEDEEGGTVIGAVLELKDLTSGLSTTFTTDGTSWQKKGLYPDHTYQIIEKEAPKGYYFMNEIDPFVPANDIQLTLTDNKIRIEVQKQNELGKKVIGAKLHLYDEENNELVSWCTTSDNFEIGEYLFAGKTYKIVETDASDIYWLTSVEFIVPKYGTSQSIIVDVVDEHISYMLDKQDESGKSIAGATLALYDQSEDGREVIRWVTSGTPMTINTLKRGHTYILKELNTPHGYIQAEDLIFTVEETAPENSIYSIVMEDKKMKLVIQKEDDNGKPLAGATLQLKDQDGNLVEEWISTEQPHELDYQKIVEGETYTLVEVDAPEGWYKADPVEITIPENPKECIFYSLKNDPISREILKVDENKVPLIGASLSLLDMGGNVLEKWISDKNPHVLETKLKDGGRYILREIEPPNGYFLAKDVIFTISKEDEKTIIQMEDKKIEADVIKVDEKNEPIAGVTLELIDVESETLLESWITSKEPHPIGSYLKQGKVYKIIEREWINGVHQATEKVFEIPAYSSQKIVITMLDLDVNIAFLKTDDNGTPLAGAKLAIVEQGIDRQETILTTFYSTEDEKGVSIDDQGREISKLLKGGNEYILRELESPYGFKKAEDLIFTVDGTNAAKQIVQMMDEREEYIFKIHKVSSKDNNQSLQGAEFEIYLKGSTEFIFKGTTDKDGNLVVNVPYWKDGYEIQETKAPTGYKIDHNILSIKIDEETYDFDVHEIMEIQIENKPEVPNTSENGPSNTFLLFSIALVSLSLILFVKYHYSA